MANCIIEAHRGVGTEYPENTMPAFRAAVDQGYGMIELDTKFTADKRCVILHDNTLNSMARRADGSELEPDTKILSFTLEQVREFDLGIAKNEKFRGVKICTLEKVLDFALETKIPLKFDNVVQKHTPAERNIFFDTIEKKNAASAVGFTASEFEYIDEILSRFPDADIHYEGSVTEENLERLGRLIQREQLTVWLRFDNSRTAWNKNIPVNGENSVMVKKYGKFGVWIISEREEMIRAIEEFGADIIETDGTLKPQKIGA